ncbi:MAG: tol-pal system protein YbgF [Desulfobacterales bacterium]|nr:tol-pal system protein YbgF [Desulfobacterales bacterium]MCP4158982.1 tol-pal system protein YbgF [Deltaproteobacteria bacterium]
MKKYIVALIFLISGCASSGDVNYLNERILELENKLQVSAEKNLSKLNEKSKKFDKTDQTQRENYAGMNTQIHQFKSELLMQKGKVEELEFFLRKLKKSNKSLSKMLEESLVQNRKLKKRFFKLEQYVGFEPVKKSDVKKIKKGEEKKLSEKELYKLAKGKLDNGKTKEARDHFLKFLVVYPKSVNADNAQFWISEIYYREKWYEKAILEYQKVIEKYPNGNKIPASYLKQGYAFYNLGEKANAKLILNELIKNFPKTNEAKYARKKLARIK